MPPEIMFPFLKLTVSDNCKFNIPEKEASRAITATRLLMGDGRGCSLNERMAATSKITTNQKEENPSNKNIPPAKCAPMVPHRFWAVPNDPVTSQNNLSEG